MHPGKVTADLPHGGTLYTADTKKLKAAFPGKYQVTCRKRDGERHRTLKVRALTVDDERLAWVFYEAVKALHRASRSLCYVGCIP